MECSRYRGKAVALSGRTCFCALLAAWCLLGLWWSLPRRGALARGFSVVIGSETHELGEKHNNHLGASVLFSRSCVRLCACCEHTLYATFLAGTELCRRVLTQGFCGDVFAFNDWLIFS